MTDDNRLEMSVINAKKRHVDRLMLHSNVSGVGVGYRVTKGRRTADLCIRVYVKKKIAEDQLSTNEILPKMLDGILVDVIEAEFHTLIGGANLTPLERRQKHPSILVGGLSVGGLGVSAGTLGGCVYERGSGRQFLLSNWHVLCGYQECPPGDEIVQPGVFDGGLATDIVARLIRTALTEHVDAAVAEVTGDRYLINWISGIGTINKIAQATLGMKVKKSGRTTGLTNGIVSDISADIEVDTSVGVRKFKDQFIVDSTDSSPVALGGDSGSLVVSFDDNRAVGLLFAGPKGDGHFFIANQIDEVLNALRVDLRNDFTQFESDLVIAST